MHRTGWTSFLLAADSFIFARPLHEVPDGESVIAGYPWFRRLGGATRWSRCPA